VARALIVACGCRGRALGSALAEGGWQVRGTTRDPAGLAAIEAAEIEAAVADPGRVGTVLDQIDGVAIVYWLLGKAEGEPSAVEAVNGARLEALFEKLVDTPVRGLVYEAAGSAPASQLAEGARIARDAAERWRIPVEVVDADPADPEGWRAAMLAAGERALLER
jgi:nucleoside-diphosphate-sugar epimerase